MTAVCAVRLVLDIPMLLSRRSFVSALSAAAAALGFGRRGRTQPAPERRDRGDGAQGPILDAIIVAKVGEVVLPAELGPAGVVRVSRAFTAWVSGFQKGAELLHPYGSPTIRYTGESPAVRWRGQLEALERDARSRHARGFLAITREQRHDLVVTAVRADRTTDRMPDPLSANHVAIALLSWYFATPEATDLCYRAQIGKNQCRPLVNSSRQPLPLAQPGLSGNGPAETSP